MRMFWACTHVMLKLTEIPLFVKAGIEIIPTEVTTSVLTPLEGIKYDDPTLPVNQIWRSTLTLPDEITTMLRRTRLWERDGNISDHEKYLFNKHIDVIYVPTRLDLAVNIQKWFKGELIYRYFGALSDGSAYLKNIPTQDLPFIKRMIYVPIFNELMRSNLQSLFDRSAVLHNYLDESIVPGTWHGYRDGAPAVIVLGGLHNSQEYQKILRDLIPLAKHIPIKLLGKNIKSQIPADITSAFDVRTNLSRTEFFSEFFDAQFLIYPHAQRNHSHNVPIEAIYGGMPIVFRTETPTFIENQHSLFTRVFPSKIGSARTGKGMMKIASDLYGKKHALSSLAEKQAFLTTPYRIENVETEVRNLIGLIRKRKDISEEQFIGTPPMSEYSPSEYYRVCRDVITPKFSAPIYYLLANSVLNHVVHIEVDGQSKTAWHVTKEICPQQIILGVIPGGEPVYFGADVDHTIRISGFTKGCGNIDFFIDIYVNGVPESVKKLSVACQSEVPAPFNVEFALSSKSKFHASLVIKTEDEGSCYLRTIEHGFQSEIETEAISGPTSTLIL